PETFHRIYALATARLGLQGLARLDECAITMRADDGVEALPQQQRWRDKALALLAHRAASQLRWPLPRIGKPTAAALSTAIGDMHPDTHGQQLVKLAGLAIRVYASGASSRKLPKLSHVGSAYLRHWLSHYALRRGAHAAPLQSYDVRR